MAKIAMFVFNDGNHDQRVHKQAQALGKLGHEVRVYCFLTPGQKPKVRRDGYLLLREDQRGRAARFFDDQIMGRLRRKRAPGEQESEPLELPADREPQLPCPKPTRHLKKQAPSHQKEHWDYIERINQVWAEKAETWQPDLVQAHDLDALRAATWLGETNDIPVIYDTHELWSEQPFIDSQEAKQYWDSLEKELIQKTDAVMTVNKPLAEILCRRYDLDEVLALHNCQEKQQLKPRPQNKKPIALYQGAYVPHRGLEQVIAAAQLTRHVDIAFRGFGPSESQLKKLDKKSKIQWWKPVPGHEVVQGAALADIGLIPFLPTCLNHYYSTPNKLFEYVSAGLAIAGSDIPEIRKFVTQYEMGELYDPYSPGQIAEVLDRLSASSSELSDKQQRARNAVNQRWHWGEEVKQYQALVEQLLSLGR